MAPVAFNLSPNEVYFKTIKVLRNNIKIIIINIRGNSFWPTVGIHDDLSKISVPLVEAIPSLFQGPIIK